MTATMQRPVDETYAECERLIKSTVNSFQRRYGGDRDELMSAAGEAFMEAYSGPKKRFTLSKKKRPGNFHFGGWLNKTIWYALLDTLNERHSHHFQPFSNLEDLSTLTADGDVAGAEAIPDRGKPSLPRKLDTVSEDAQRIAWFALEQFTEKDGEGIARRLKAFRMVLSELGWAAKRFWRAVGEIREVIGS